MSQHPASKYKPEFAQQFIELSKQGKSANMIASHFGVSLNTVRTWSNDPNKPEFMSAYEEGYTHFEAWMEDNGQKGMKGHLAKFSASTWIYMMKCYFKKSQRWIEVNIQKIEDERDATKLSDKDINERIKQLLGEAANRKKLPARDDSPSEDIKS